MIAVVSAIVTAGQWWEIHSGSVDTHALAEAAKRQANIAENTGRAWIAPIKFSLVNLDDPVEPLKVSLFYQNVGREPATSLKNNLTSGYIATKGTPPDKWQTLQEWDKIPSASNLCMDAINTTTSNVAYPSQNIGFTVDIKRFDTWNISDAMLSQFFAAVKDQTVLYYVAGCFSYETAGKMKFSAFCAYLNPIPDKQISQWGFSSCPVGNEDKDGY
jgi:hypothetical protein